MRSLPPRTWNTSFQPLLRGECVSGWLLAFHVGRLSAGESAALAAAAKPSAQDPRNLLGNVLPESPGSGCREAQRGPDTLGQGRGRPALSQARRPGLRCPHGTPAGLALTLGPQGRGCAQSHGGSRPLRNFLATPL